MFLCISSKPHFYNFIQSLLVDLNESNELIAKYLDYSAGLPVLDVGCGTGNNSHHFEPADYLGIDLSEDYISFARKQHPNTRFEVLPAEKLGTLGIKFDRILIWGVFHHINDEQVGSILQSLRQVTTPGGFCLISEAVWPERKTDVLGWLLRKMDAGKFIRTQAEWRELLSRHASVDIFTPYYSKRLPSLLCKVSFSS